MNQVPSDASLSNRPPPASHMVIMLNILSQRDEPAYVRSSLTIEQLIQETLNAFQGELSTDASYLLLDENEQILAQDQVLGDLQAKEMSRLHLLLRYENEVTRRQRVRLEVQGHPNKSFEIVQQQTLIGRPDNAEGMLLDEFDIDLSALPGWQTVSRPHAIIKETEGNYTIETIEGKRPIMVNGVAVPPGQLYTLQPGDLISVGRVELVFVVETLG